MFTALAIISLIFITVLAYFLVQENRANLEKHRAQMADVKKEVEDLKQLVDEELPTIIVARDRKDAG